MVIIVADYNDVLAISINVILAIIPSILLLLYVYKMDVVEKEPTTMLFILFFLGVLSTVPAAFVEKSLINIFEINPTDYLTSFILSFCIIGAVEEGYKFLILVLGTWKNTHFDHKYDGIVYAVFISLGFATLENILYIHNNGNDVAVLRAIVSVPAHAFYAVASGYYLGHAKEHAHHGNKAKFRLCIFLSILTPIILHGTFDYLLFLDNDIILLVFFAFVALLYMVSYCSIKKVSNTKMIKESLDEKNTVQENIFEPVNVVNENVEPVNPVPENVISNEPSSPINQNVDVGGEVPNEKVI